MIDVVVVSPDVNLLNQILFLCLSASMLTLVVVETAQSEISR